MFSIKLRSHRNCQRFKWIHLRFASWIMWYREKEAKDQRVRISFWWHFIRCMHELWMTVCWYRVKIHLLKLIYNCSEIHFSLLSSWYRIMWRHCVNIPRELSDWNEWSETNSRPSCKTKARKREKSNCCWFIENCVYYRKFERLMFWFIFRHEMWDPCTVPMDSALSISSERLAFQWKTITCLSASSLLFIVGANAIWYNFFLDIQ